MFASVLLASRLPSNLYVFALLSLAIEAFALFPIMTHHLKVFLKDIVPINSTHLNFKIEIFQRPTLWTHICNCDSDSNFVNSYFFFHVCTLFDGYSFHLYRMSLLVGVYSKI